MNTEEAYNTWSAAYDSSTNATRDLEATALQHALESYDFESCLEIGCGTGKNTVWLAQRAARITAMDLSEKMLEKAKEKFEDGAVNFICADINNNWAFLDESYDLVSFSLVLEHIEHLEHVFREAFKVLNNGGYIYIGELHPYKQYSGSKARFETPEGLQIVTCYNHHLSDFTNAARKYGLQLVAVDEYFDNDDRSTLPRILTLVFQKSNP